MAGLPAFDRQHTVERLRDPLRIFDAMGLALFAVYGTGKALAFGLGPVNAPLLGRLGGIGGGIVRNLLLTRMPVVLQAELYTAAARVSRQRGRPTAFATATRHPGRCAGRLCASTVIEFAGIAHHQMNRMMGCGMPMTMMCGTMPMMVCMH